MSSSHDIQITCRKCKKQSPMRDMRYDVNGKDLVCRSCSETVVEGSQYKKQLGKNMQLSKSKSTTSDRDNADKIRYYCVACRYSFTRNQDLDVRICPYCSKPAVKRYNLKSSAELLNESEDPFD